MLSEMRLHEVEYCGSFEQLETLHSSCEYFSLSALG